MPLNPQIKPLVDLVNAAAENAPSIWDQTVADRRESYLAMSSLSAPGPELERVEDGEIDGVSVRYYAGPDPVGVFLFFHGGGWTIGDLDTHDGVCRQLAEESGSTVIAVDYRLAPEDPFPAGLEDSWAVFTWIDANRDTFGPNTRIVVGGDSAGGNFAAVIALMARDAGLDLAAQLLIYPGVKALDDSPSMTENATGYILQANTIEWFGAHYDPDPDDWRASPILADSHTGVAPALIITAEFDPLRDQGAAYADVLRQAGVETSHTNYEGQVHVFFQLLGYTDDGTAAVTQVADAARDALR
jgi:acetyl esterase